MKSVFACTTVGMVARRWSDGKDTAWMGEEDCGLQGCEDEKCWDHAKWRAEYRKQLKEAWSCVVDGAGSTQEDKGSAGRMQG